MALIAVTDKKREANARNARHSTGPRTDEGKARVSTNAVTHGCSVSAARVYKPLREEDPAYFNELLLGYNQAWNPANRMEQSMVHALAATWMKIERSERWASSVLNGIMETRQRILGQPSGISADDDLGCAIAMTDKDGGPMWDKSQRHSTTAWRDFHRMTDQLIRMQKLRLQQQPGRVYGSPSEIAAPEPAIAETTAPEQPSHQVSSGRESTAPPASAETQATEPAPDMGLFCVPNPPPVNSTPEPYPDLGRALAEPENLRPVVAVKPASQLVLPVAELPSAALTEVLQCELPKTDSLGMSKQTTPLPGN